MAAPPIILNNPYLLVGGSLQMRGHGRSIEFAAEDEFVDVETFDNPGGEAPGKVVYEITMDILQSFRAADGFYNNYRALYVANRIQPYVFKPADAAVSDTNPQWNGTLYLPTPPIINAEVGQPTTFPLTFKVIGAPTYAVS